MATAIFVFALGGFKWAKDIARLYFTGLIIISPLYLLHDDDDDDDSLCYFIILIYIAIC